MQTKLTDHAERLDDQCNDIDELKKGLNAVLVKLAVPLFLCSLFGTAIGAVIVWGITRGMK